MAFGILTFLETSNSSNETLNSPNETLITLMLNNVTQMYARIVHIDNKRNFHFSASSICGYSQKRCTCIHVLMKSDMYVHVDVQSAVFMKIVLEKV